MADLYISWPDYHQKIEQLAANIYQSGWSFNQIVCIARGGLRVGDLLSRLYDLPLAILSTSSYADHRRGELHIAGHLTMATDQLGDRVLLVDDLVDSGVTLEKTVLWLQERYPAEVSQIRTAVLWHKSASGYLPDYYVDSLPDNPWIHQPFEAYEQLTPEQLARRYARVPEAS